MEEKNEIYPRIILGLDVSTSCIGISIVEDTGDGIPKIIAITHKSPRIPRKIKGIEALCLRKNAFDDGFLKQIHEYCGDKKITDVVIEEPLLSSNNVYTVGTLLRFNGMIADAVYNTLGLVPNFISSYDARLWSFPQLVSIRKHKKNGEEYPFKHIENALKKNETVLFGSYQFDVDKKTIMMNMVNEQYVGENSVPWEYGKNGELKKENYDACDSLICALAYININRYGVEKPVINDYNIQETKEEYIINYSTKIWNKIFKKLIVLKKEKENKENQ